MASLGYDVVIAVNGLEGVSIFKESAFDLVVTDIQMPVMDGLEATRLMRQHEVICGRRTPIVAVSAGVERIQCLSAGMHAFIQKPIHAQEFRDVLNQLVLREQ
jgi:CheY-like chemotaxis protein